MTVAATHLSFVPGWNVVQLRALLRAVGRTGRVLVMGDLNMSVATARRASSLTPLVTAPTYPAPAPLRQLDHLLVRGAATVTASAAACLPLSDHCALQADVGAWRLA
jgi:endonuclease/exonuclease/phosphatase family metal-dependent hydrolase